MSLRAAVRREALYQNPELGMSITLRLSLAAPVRPGHTVHITLLQAVAPELLALELVPTQALALELAALELAALGAHAGAGGRQ